MLSETTRAYFNERQKQEKGPLGDAMRAWLANPADGAAADAVEADESEVGLTRTRCVPTRLFAGHADNALPQLATAMINCRIFPGIDPNDVQRELTAVVADSEVIVSRNDDYTSSLSSPLRPDVMARFCQGGPHAASRGADLARNVHRGKRCASIPDRRYPRLRYQRRMDCGAGRFSRPRQGRAPAGKGVG